MAVKKPLVLEEYKTSLNFGEGRTIELEVTSSGHVTLALGAEFRGVSVFMDGDQSVSAAGGMSIFIGRKIDSYDVSLQQVNGTWWQDDPVDHLPTLRATFEAEKVVLSAEIGNVNENNEKLPGPKLLKTVIGQLKIKEP